MNITNKILKDRATLTYTYSTKCIKCGYTETVDMPKKRELEISQLPCKKCYIPSPIPQVVIPEKPVVKQKPKPVKRIKKVTPKKSNRKK